MFLNVFTCYLIWARHCRDNLFDFVPVSGPHPTFGLAESRPALDLQQSGRLCFDLFFVQRSTSDFFPSSSTAYLADMNGQKKGGCGHFMAEWDQHGTCPACRDCVFPDRPSSLSGIYARTARSRFVCATLASAASETESAQGRFALRRESVWHCRVLGRRRRRPSEIYLGPHCLRTGRGRGQCGIAATTDRWKWSLPVVYMVAG